MRLGTPEPGGLGHRVANMYAYHVIIAIYLSSRLKPPPCHLIPVFVLSRMCQQREVKVCSVDFKFSCLWTSYFENSSH